MVQGVVVAHVLGALQLLHVEDLGAGELVRVLNGALALLLIHDGPCEALLHSHWLRGLLLVLIAFVSILVSLYTKVTSNQPQSQTV